MGVVAAVVVVLIIVFFLAMRTSGANDPFQAAAASLGLKLTRSVPDLLPRVEGMVNGLPIRIDIPDRGATARYRTFYPPLGMALRLERETTISRTMGELGQTDTQVGEATFDNMFKVNTSRPDALQKMMTPQLRRSLVQLLDAYPKMLIEDGGMTYVSDTAEPTQEEIVRITTAMAAAAHQLVGNRPPPLEKSQPRPQPKPAAQPTSTPAPTDRDQGAKAGTAAPGPSSRPTPPDRQRPAPVTESAQPEPPPSPPPSTGLPDGFFEEAFGANRLSFESEDDFEEQLGGTVVSLSGTVKQAREVEDDTKVSVGPSTKVTVTVAQIDNDLYGKTDIDAIVFLPKGNAENLDRGTHIAFTGSLETIDPFMRNLFVTNARLQG